MAIEVEKLNGSESGAEELVSIENGNLIDLTLEIDADDLAVLASKFSISASETRQMVAARVPSNDGKKQRERANAVLASLESQIEMLRSKLDGGSQDFKAIMIAVAENDYEELAQLGVNTEFAWLDDVVAAIISDGPYVGIETIGPYAAHHVDDSGNLSVSEVTMPPDEVTGLLLGKIVRSMTQDVEHVRLVALLDDFTHGPDSSPFTLDQQNLYMVVMGKLFKRNGIIFPDDVAGKDYLLLRESEQVFKIDQLIETLKNSNAGFVDTTSDGDVIFYPTKRFIDKLALGSNNRRDEFRRRGISILREGRPTCCALDAATYLHPRNKEAIHVVILDQRFKSQQDKTYALLRALDVVSQDSYHNVFFDSKALSPELIAYTVCVLFQKHVRSFLRRLDQMNAWEEFNPTEYAHRNYGERILSADRAIIKFVIKQLAELNISFNSLDLVADVGAGPNIYPAMLLAPYVSNTGAIDMIEYTSANRSYVNGILKEDANERAMSIWNKFEQFAAGVGGEKYVGALDRTYERVNVVAGSIFDLPRNRYDLVSSYFVCESITTSFREFWMSIRALASSVKKDGTLVVAHMVGSQGWHAGEGTHFPAVNLCIEDIEEAYRDADLSFEIFAVNDETDKAREGYRGMAVVVARHVEPGS